MRWKCIAGIDRHQVFVTDEALSLAGKTVANRELRFGVVRRPEGGKMVVTIQPSCLLRLEDACGKQVEYRRFVHDLKAADEVRAPAAAAGKAVRFP